MTKRIPFPRKKPKSYADLMRENAVLVQHNQALARYADEQEKALKDVLVAATEQYDLMRLIVVSGQEKFVEALEKICLRVVPFCEDIESMNLTPFQREQVDRLTKQLADAKIKAQGGTPG